MPLLNILASPSEALDCGTRPTGARHAPSGSLVSDGEIARILLWIATIGAALMASMRHAAHLQLCLIRQPGASQVG